MLGVILDKQNRSQAMRGDKRNCNNGNGLTSVLMLCGVPQ